MQLAPVKNMIMIQTSNVTHLQCIPSGRSSSRGRNGGEDGGKRHGGKRYGGKR